jgi:hypothetical protein
MAWCSVKHRDNFNFTTSLFPTFCAFLNGKFPHIWTARGVTNFLAPFLFTSDSSGVFLGGRGGVVKDPVCRDKVQNVNELRDSVARAAEHFTNEMLAVTWRETECRLEVRRTTYLTYLLTYLLTHSLQGVGNSLKS